MIIEELQIEDVTPDEIDDDAPLFGEGLELDSDMEVEIGPVRIGKDGKDQYSYKFKPAS